MSVLTLTKRFDATNITGVTFNDFLLTGTNKWTAVNTNDGNASGIYTNSGSTFTQGFKMDTTFPERMSKVVRVRAWAYVTNAPGNTGNSVSNTLNMRRGASVVTGTAFSVLLAWSGAYNLVGPYTYTKPGGGVWVEEDFRDNALQFEVHHPSDTNNDIKLTEMWFEVDYEPGIPVEQNQAINRGSHLVRMFGGAVPVISAKLHPKYLKLDLMDEVLIYDPELPMTAQERDVLVANAGLGEEHAGIYGRLVDSELDMDAHSISARIADLTSFRTLLWSTGQSPDDVDNQNRGHAELLNGATRAYVRNRFAYIPDSAQANSIIRLAQVYPDVEPRNHKGVMLDAPDNAGNELDNSCFDDSLTGWTTAGTAGVGTITAVPARFFEDLDISDKAAEFEKLRAPRPR